MKKHLGINKAHISKSISGIYAPLRANSGIIAGAVAGFVVSFALQINFAVPLFILLSAIYLKSLYKDLSGRPYRLLNLSFLFVLITVASYIIIKQGGSAFYIPFCTVPMLAIILFNELVVSLVLTVACAVAVSSISGNNFYLGMLFLANGILSILLAKGVRKRNTIIRAGLILGAAQAFSLFLISYFRIDNPKSYFILFGNGVACGIIVLGVLSIFEYLFGTITNITLLELADFNHPILNRMMLEAPGTYHHSLIVGNLSEAACGIVGANSLLARIGAYYHDIGKIQKPEYFSENQSITSNKHDNLAPTMSKLVIMNHVKEGVEMAKRYRLNPRLIDFIQLHHGNSLVYYFYRRALETLEEDQEVKEEGFRYAGPRPNTKETAVVMLADSVEAATRALKEPTPAKIEEVVHKIINNKFIDGQLDECDLTLKDLEKISSVFIRILGGIYHSRVNYPDEKVQSNGKKPAKEASHQPEENKKPGI
ncbi:MAG: HDIG domain-containing protein [Candidatus Omnitrophica bacterium]|nr:HDIG domain-containing protein [Candidatus Omnitrophota bacterium]